MYDGRRSNIHLLKFKSKDIRLLVKIWKGLRPLILLNKERHYFVLIPTLQAKRRVFATWPSQGMSNFNSLMRRGMRSVHLQIIPSSFLTF